MAERVPIALELTYITYSFFLLWPTLVNTNVDCEQNTPVSQLLSARTNKKKSSSTPTIRGSEVPAD